MKNVKTTAPQSRSPLLEHSSHPAFSERRSLYGRSDFYLLHDLNSKGGTGGQAPWQLLPHLCPACCGSQEAKPGTASSDLLTLLTGDVLLAG